MKKVIFGLLMLSTLSQAITLDEVVQTALKSSPVLKTSKLEVRVEKYRLKQIKKSRLGEVSVFGAYNRYEDKRIVYPIAVPLNPQNLVGAENQFAVGIEYKVPLFLGFKLIKNVEISEIQKNLKEIQHNLTKQELVYNVKAVYIKILSLQKQKEALISYKTALDKLYENISLMVSLGKKPEVDLLKVDYEREKAKAAITQVENNIRTLKETLKTLTGDESLKIDYLEDINLTKDINFTYKNLQSLSKLKVYTLKENIYQKKAKTSIGEYLPKVYLHLLAQRNIGAGEYKDLWNVGLSFNWTVFDFGKNYDNYIKTKLEASKLKLQKKTAYLKIKQEVLGSLSKIDSLQKQIKALEKQLKFSKKVEEVEKVKYEEGVSDIYDYLKAKANYLMAKSNYYKAVYDREIQINYLKYLLEKQ